MELGMGLDKNGFLLLFLGQGESEINKKVEKEIILIMDWGVKRRDKCETEINIERKQRIFWHADSK